MSTTIEPEWSAAIGPSSRGIAVGMDETSDVILAGDWREALPALLGAL